MTRSTHFTAASRRPGEVPPTRSRWWTLGLIGCGLVAVLIAGRGLFVGDTGAWEFGSSTELADPLDHPFSAVVRLVATDAEGAQLGQDYVIDYRDRNDWTMTTENPFSSNDTGAQPDLAGTLTVARDGWLRTYSAQAVLVDELALDSLTGATPLGLFSMEFLHSNGQASQRNDTIEFTVDSPEASTTYVYDREGNPIAARTFGRDGFNSELTVIRYEPATR